MSVTLAELFGLRGDLGASMSDPQPVLSRQGFLSISDEQAKGLTMESTEPSFKRPVRTYFEGRCGEWAVTALRLYCNGMDREGQPLFTGSRFERFADGDHPDTFTTSDIVAVSMLSVNVPAPAAIQLLEDVKAGELLRKIGPDRPIWEVEEADLGEDSPATELWYHLQNLENVGPVTAGKLIAAKRPQLVPIYDQHVGRALSPPRGKFWVAMHRSMGDAHGAASPSFAPLALTSRPFGGSTSLSGCTSTGGSSPAGHWTSRRRLRRDPPNRHR